MDIAALNGYIATAKAAIAQIEGILVQSQLPDGGAIQPAPAPVVAAPLTTFRPGAGTPLPDTDPIPDKARLTLAEWLDFLDDHSITLLATKTDTWPGEGDFLGYAMYRGGYASNVAIWLAKEWGAKYPPALTHCQLLRAVQQGVPYDADIGARWNAAERTWFDATGRPYVARTDWTSTVAR